jgi:hypothetical protein
MIDKVARAIYQARKDGSEIKANIRLKKNGRFSSVSGKIEDLKVAKDGFAYATVKVDKKDRSHQNVRLDNILCVSKDNKVYRK